MAATEPSSEVVEAALAELQAWPGLARSPQLSKFLNYIVHAKLSGDEASIKAYAIAVDVFGRAASFDPQSDPIVRVQAGRLRAALAEYYRGEGSTSPVIFYLPVGRYIPEFRLREVATAAEAVAAEPIPPSSATAGEPPAVGRRRRGRVAEAALIIAFAAVALGIVLVLGQVLQPRPTRLDVPRQPYIAIAEFTAVSGGEAALANVAGLAVELVTDLQLFEDIDVAYLQGGGADGSGAEPTYQLTGIARTEGNEVQVTASLKRSGSDLALWSATVNVEANALTASVDGISRTFAEQLGAQRGPLHVDALRWLEANPELAGNETPYVCGLLFGRYRDSNQVADAARARDCASRLLAREPGLAPVLAMSGALLVDDVLALTPGGYDPEPMQQAGRLFDEALRGAPTSSFVWELYARYLEGSGRLGEADAAYASALQLNPANLDAVAAYGRMLSLGGPSQRGASLAELAIDHSVQPPHWYHAALAVNALRAGDNNVAISHAEQLASGDAELASVVATVAAFRTGSEEVLNRFFAQMLDVTRFRQFGILPVLRQRIPDAALVDQISIELQAAGVATSSLNSRF